MRITQHSSLTIAAATLTAAAALVLTGCSSGGGPSILGTSDGGSSSSTQTSSAPTAAGLNTPVKAGTFQFTALDVKDAGTTIGTSPLTENAQGTFYQVDLKIENVGSSAQTFIVNDLKLVDDGGKTYDADSTASLYASPDSSTWLAAINPGNSIQGPVIFDIPVGTKPVTLRVSDSAFGTGQPISLG